MNILWEIKIGFFKDIYEEWVEEPKPHYNTISTIIRILKDKKFVGHKAFGRSHQYFPIMSKDEYQKTFIQNAKVNVFSGSLTSLISNILDSEDISDEEMTEIRKVLNSKQ